VLPSRKRSGDRQESPPKRLNQDVPNLDNLSEMTVAVDVEEVEEGVFVMDL